MNRGVPAEPACRHARRTSSFSWSPSPKERGLTHKVPPFVRIASTICSAPWEWADLWAGTPVPRTSHRQGPARKLLNAQDNLEIIFDSGSL